MIKYLLLFGCATLAFAQDYKLETITSALPGVPAAYASMVDVKGYRVSGPAGPWCEIWLRKSIPASAKSGDPGIGLGA